MMKHVIEAGKNIVDISFYPEDLGLDDLLKKKVWWLLWTVVLRQEWEILFLGITITIWKLKTTNVWLEGFRKKRMAIRV